MSGHIWSSSRVTSQIDNGGEAVSGGPGLAAVFDPHERHEVRATTRLAPAARAGTMARRRPSRGTRLGEETAMAEIQFKEITKRYPDGFEAVKAIDLEIGDGEFMILVGPSGCGKSTALRMIAGLEDITDGRPDHRRGAGQRPCAARPRHRDGLPELRAVSAHDRARQHGLRAQARQGRQGRRSTRRSARRRRSSTSSRTSSASRPTSPAASASASRWAARSCATRRRS